MENKTQNHEAMLKAYNVAILEYIYKESPSTKQVLYFVGTLLNSLLSDLKMTADEKALYLAVYNTTIRKNIFEAKVVKEPENTKQSEFAMV